MQKTVYELFDELDPKQKASFIDARLDWATNGAICGEITLRLCHPTEEIAAEEERNNHFDAFCER